MVVLHALWLPMAVSSVFVFIVSSIIHMVIRWHRSDYGKVPQEDKVMEALRQFSIPPGDYMMPDCENPSEMRSPEFKEKWKKGPVGVFTIMPNQDMSIRNSLILWFLYLAFVNVVAGYVTCHAVMVGTEFGRIAKYAAITSFLGYAPALWQMSIWYKRSWATTAKCTIDGAIYAAVTALTFGWLWPR